MCILYLLVKTLGATDYYISIIDDISTQWAWFIWYNHNKVP